MVRAEMLSVRSSLYIWVLYGNLWREDVSVWLLEAVARERPVKTQQAGKRLGGCCGDLWIVEISSGAVIVYTVVSRYTSLIRSRSFDLYQTGRIPNEYFP
jgi:hypothetical protein